MCLAERFDTDLAIEANANSRPLMDVGERYPGRRDLSENRLASASRLPNSGVEHQACPLQYYIIYIMRNG